MSAKYKSPSFLLPNEINTNTNPLNTDGDPATGTGINSLYSMDFKATNQSVFVSSSDAFNFGTGDFTMSAWIKVDSFGSGYYPYILDFRSTGTANENAVAFYLDPNGILQVWIAGGPGGSAIIGSSGTALVANTWYNVILKRESGTLSTHINGGSADQTASYTGNMSTTPSLTIGARAGNTQSINGKIDEVAIFNRALNTTEIAALYDGTGSNIRPSNLIASNLNPIAYYPLGEQAQNTGYLTQEITNGWQFPNGVLQDYVMDFDGTSPGDAITSNTSGITGNAARTVSFWYNIGISSSAMIPFSLGGINLSLIHI